ncbi:hypothetical protein KCP77_11025 [Salmonella enterica subsp. enterica]|nr:hypothetical protein KCP77_11025 [Salmonella enterica subsp. enterica]
MSLACCCRIVIVMTARVFIIVTRLINAVNEYHFMWEGRLHRIGASAGITMINERNCQLTEEVVSQADIACYAAKIAVATVTTDVRTAARINLPSKGMMRWKGAVAYD